MPFYYAVIDFECTCWERNDNEVSPPHEIIEFPVVFLNSETLKIDYEFQAYVCPSENPVLSPFCFKLTGIEQKNVDCSDELRTVLRDFSNFLLDNDITDFLMCTDGPWDFSRFLYPECKRKNIPYPEWARTWLDIRWRFQQVYKLEKWKSVSGMLEHLGLEFEGREHSGIDDARNIVRIVAAVHRSLTKCLPGKVLRPNRHIDRFK